ncbi:hypothetical protein GCM10009557_65730 [Virgisporangium ochraceum]
MPPSSPAERDAREDGTVAELVVLTGPLAAGRNTVADRLTALLTAAGRTVVVADLTIDSAEPSADRIATAIAERLGAG